MLTARVWIASWVLCAMSATAIASAVAVADAETPVLRDGFEHRAPEILIQDAVDRSSAIRAAIAEYWAIHSELPASLAVLGYADPFPAGPALVTWQSGVLRLTFEGDLAGETLAFATWLQAGVLRWSCGRAPAPIDATLVSGSGSSMFTSVTDSLLPDACRIAPPPALLVLDVALGTSMARTPITESWASTGTLPSSLAQLGLPETLPIAQARVQFVDGVLVAVFAGDLDGQRIALAPWALGGAMQWICGHALPPPGATALGTGTASANTTLDPALLPDWCRA